MLSPAETSAQSTSTAARRLAKAILAASKSSSHRPWTTEVEFAVRRHLAAADKTLTPPLVAAAIDPHLLRHSSLAAGLFGFSGSVLTPSTVHSLLKSFSLSPRRQSVSLLSLLRRVTFARLALLPTSYPLAISALLSSDQPAEAFRLFVDGPISEYSPALFNSLLAGTATDVLIVDAWKVFDTMLELNVMFNNVGFGIFIHKICQDELLIKILDLVEMVKKRYTRVDGSIMATLVVDGLCRARRMEDAWKALDELRFRECKPDFITYRIVSEGFRLAGRVEEQWRILKQKRKLGVAPRMNDYEDFLLSLISERRVLEAKEIGEAIVLGDFPLRDHVLNMLIGSVSSVDPSSAVFFCNYMIQKENYPSLVVLCRLCRSLCKNEKGDEIWCIFKSLMQKAYFSNKKEYHVMVSFLCKARKLREAYDVLKEMKRKGLQPDVSSYNALMEACCKDNLLRPAKKLWDEMFSSRCNVNLHTYNILISKFSELGETEEAMQLFDNMLQKQVFPDAVTYTSLVRMFCSQMKIEQAITIFNKSVEQNRQLAPSLLNTMTFLLCEKGNVEAALSILRCVPSFIETSDSHVIVLRKLTEAGNVQSAIQQIDWIKNNQASLLPKILNDLMFTLSSAKNLDPVLELLRDVQSSNLADVSVWRNVFG